MVSSPQPRVSVVVAAWNCSDTIRKCLDALLAMDHSSYEVIVVDDGSTDGTAEICEDYQGVRVLRVDRGGPSRARNAGVAAALGTWVAFTDADCIVDRDWLRELEKGYTDPSVAGVGGDQKSPEDETEFGRTVQDFFKSIGFMTGYIGNARVMTTTEHNPSCNASYLRRIVEELGGFDEELWPGEDVDLDYRLRRRGYRLVFNPGAVVAHYRPRSYRALVRMMYRYGASQYHLVKKYGLFRRLHWQPVVLILGLILMAVLVSWNPTLWPVLLLPGAAPLAGFLARSRELGTSIRFTVLFVLTVVAWNWGFFTGWRYRLPAAGGCSGPSSVAPPQAADHPEK